MFVFSAVFGRTGCCAGASQVFMNDIKMQEMLEKDLKKAQAKLNNLEVR